MEPKVYYHIHKRSILQSVLVDRNPVHIFTVYFFKINFILLHSLYLHHPSGLYLSYFQTKTH